MILPDPQDLLREMAAAMRPAVHSDSAMIGIYTGGVWVAEALHRALALTTPLGTLATTLYRDDYAQIGLHAEKRPTQIPFAVEGRDLVLVDDVLYTGRTIRAAINEIFDFGRPRTIRLACLLDRGGRELPIAPDWVGARIRLAAHEMFALSREAGVLALRVESRG
jgi:pyrimidine operon attenuation protein/uracil phosphoribosyltransferase